MKLIFLAFTAVVGVSAVAADKADPLDADGPRATIHHRLHLLWRKSRRWRSDRGIDTIPRAREAYTPTIGQQRNSRQVYLCDFAC